VTGRKQPAERGNWLDPEWTIFLVLTAGLVAAVMVAVIRCPAPELPDLVRALGITFHMDLRSVLTL
jgi:hypothetical protein